MKAGTPLPRTHSAASSERVRLRPRRAAKRAMRLPCSAKSAERDSANRIQRAGAVHVKRRKCVCTCAPRRATEQQRAASFRLHFRSGRTRSVTRRQ
jgi:hypothetical protein